ncbi:MAG: hypothetical protein AAF655_28535, partial [Bacteroidota bacterium]
YCLLGVLFNLVSMWVGANGGQGLTPTDPLVGIMVMLIYGLFLISGKKKKVTLYRILMGLAVLVFGYGGIIKHIILLSSSPELYNSLASGLSAVLINFFGLGLNTLAALGKFH